VDSESSVSLDFGAFEQGEVDEICGLRELEELDEVVRIMWLPTFLFVMSSVSLRKSVSRDVS